MIACALLHSCNHVDEVASNPSSGMLAIKHWTTKNLPSTPFVSYMVLMMIFVGNKSEGYVIQ